MNVRRVDPAFQDARGVIVDVLQDEPIEHVTVIESEAGAVRGNHFHRETVQWVYVVSGAVRYVVGTAEGEREEGIIRKGDLLLTEAMDSHAMEFLEPTTMVVLTRGPRGGEHYEQDTYRLAEPLIEKP